MFVDFNIFPSFHQQDTFLTTGLSKAKVRRNWLQHLKMPSNHSNIIGLPCKISKSCHYGLLRNRAFYTSQWPKKYFRKIARIATSRKRQFRSLKRKSENTFQYKLPPKTWGKSPQKPLSATRKCFFGHCDV